MKIPLERMVFAITGFGPSDSYVQFPTDEERLRAIEFLTTHGGYTRYKGNIFGVSNPQKEKLTKQRILFEVVDKPE